MRTIKCLINKFCHWFLKAELDSIQLEYDIMRRNYENCKDELRKYQRFNVMPTTLFVEVVKHMPDPKQFKSNPCCKERFKVKIFNVSVSVTIIPADTDHIRIFVGELGIDTTVECVLKNGGYDILGVNTAISAWFWNWSRSGLTIISDTDFSMIIQFMKAQNNVLTEFNE